MIRDAFVAIADPTRRQILELLNDHDVVAAGEVAAHVRGVSRPAVSRHLRILRECGVVTVSRRGKNQIYALNAAPIEAIRQGWLSGFAKKQAKSLQALRDVVESRTESG